MEKGSCFACNVPFDHGRRNPRFFALNCEWDPGSGVWAADKLEKIENLSSYPLLASGVTCGVASILARAVGKRPNYLASTRILLITCIWSALIGKDYGSFFAARLICRVGLRSCEALVLSSIGDMYFAGPS